MDSLEEYKRPFDYGWVREVVYRKKGERCDIYYKHGASKLRSSKELMAFLTKNNDHKLTQDNFYWKCQPLGIGEPMEVVSMKTDRLPDIQSPSSSGKSENKEGEEKLVKKSTARNVNPVVEHEQCDDYEATTENVTSSQLGENEPNLAGLVKKPKTKSKKGKEHIFSVENKSVVPEYHTMPDIQTSSGAAEKRRSKGKKKQKRNRQISDKDIRQTDSADRESDDSSDSGLLSSMVNKNIQKGTFGKIPVLDREEVDTSAVSELQQNHGDTFPDKDLEEQLAEMEMEIEPKEPKKKSVQQKGKKGVNLKSSKSSQSYGTVESSGVEGAEITGAHNGNVEDVLDNPVASSSNVTTRKHSMPQSPYVLIKKHKMMEEPVFQMQATKKLRSSNIPLASSSLVPSSTEAVTETLIESDLVNPSFMKPMDLGWKREVVYRKNKGKSKECDIYYYSPAKKRFRSSKQIARQGLGSKLSVENFSFVKRPLGLPEGLEIVRRAK